MKALITGASSGIGRDMARVLSKRGYDLILVARRVDRLEELKEELGTGVEVIGLDLARTENCFALFEQVREQEVDLLINNAGFGVFGAFDKTDLHRELEMIDLNIRAVHILTKLFVRKFKQADRGAILNVSSSAAFLPGPLLSSYYASKAYVLRLSEAIYEELRRDASGVSISVLCPGPVQTEFDAVADVRFSVRGLNSYYVAQYAIDQALKGKLLIIPGGMMKTARVLEKFVPEKMLLRISYHMQHRKNH